MGKMTGRKKPNMGMKMHDDPKVKVLEKQNFRQTAGKMMKGGKKPDIKAHEMKRGK